MSSPSTPNTDTTRVEGSLYGADVISLGGNITPNDLALSRQGQDLWLHTSSTDRIVLKDWYVDAQHHGVGQVQFISAASSAPTVFNLTALAATFDAQAPSSTPWAASAQLASVQLTGISTPAGGTLSLAYGQGLAMDNIWAN